MRNVTALILMLGLVLLGTPPVLGTAVLGAQSASVAGSGFGANSTVQLVDANGSVIATGTADASGNVTFSSLPAGQTFSMVGEDSSGNVVVATDMTDDDNNPVAAVAASGAVATAAVASATAAASSGGLSAVAVGVLAAAGVAGTAGGVAAARSSTATICHVTGVSPQTVDVNDSELPAHLGHGDTEGACPASPE